ncbi:hypothetical protein Barb4_03515 [Bacteroidales bacterium Barb4]|nr:hypothetical protein Barb4_03515 [Bacteroidales bacterium Barb4]
MKQMIFKFWTPYLKGQKRNVGEYKKTRPLINQHIPSLIAEFDYFCADSKSED